MTYRDYDPLLGKFGKPADALSFIAIFLTIIYLGIQTKLPGRSQYQDLAKDQASLNAETVYFSKYLANPEVIKKKDAEPTQRNEGIIERFSLIKSILADQDNKDDQIHKTASAGQNSDQNLEDSTYWSQKPFSFLSSFFTNSSGEQQNRESSFFDGLFSKVKNSDYYDTLVNLLADSGTEDKEETTEQKTEKTKITKSFFSLSFPSFESIFADQDVTNPVSGEQKEKQAPSQKVQEPKIIKDAVTQKGREEKSTKDAKLETDDLLEAFRTFLQGYATGKNSAESGKEIKKINLENTNDDSEENVDNKSSYESIKTRQKSSEEKSMVRNKGMHISEILRSFLVDEELNSAREEDSKSTFSKSDDSHDQNHILEALGKLLAEKKDKNNVKPSSDIYNTLQRFLADNQQKETNQNIENMKQKEPTTSDQREESEAAKFFKVFLADDKIVENSIDDKNHHDKNIQGDFQSFFSNLFENKENNAKPNNAEKTQEGAEILSFFKNQIKSSTQKNQKNPVKEFVDVFASFLADDGSVHEEIPNDDPFHLNIQSFLSNGDGLKLGFSDEIKRFSSYLKKFIYSDYSEGHASKKETFESDGNLITKLFENVLA